MNDIQILKAVKKRERGSRLLYYADFTDACWENVAKSYGTKKDREEFCIERGFFISKVLFPKRRDDAPKLDFSQYFRDIKIPEGVKPDPEGMLMMPGSTYHFTHLISPLRNIYDFDEIRRFPIYRRKEHFDFSHYKRVVEESHARGQTVKAWAGRFFETAWPLRGYENMLADMIVEPETAEYFLDIETDFNKAKVTAAAEAGADMLVFGDDVGTQKGMMFSAALWRQTIKPRFASVIQTARNIAPDIIVWYHSCGDITEIIPDLIEIGVDILNPIQPECMDIWDIHKRYKDKLSFDGGLGTQKLIPFGTPKEIEAAVKKLVEVFGQNGGFILSPSHVLEPEVPPDNVKAFLDAAQQYCSY